MTGHREPPNTAKLALRFATDRKAILEKLATSRREVDRMQKETMAVVAKTAGA